jgi:hypothetical protein
MPIEEKSLKAGVTFALAIVKAGVISDRAASSRIRAALQVMFPEVSVILVAENDEPPSRRSRRELAEFANDAPCLVIPSSKITSN